VLASRYLERIADHAVDIGERLVYMVTGEFDLPAETDEDARESSEQSAVQAAESESSMEQESSRA